MEKFLKSITRDNVSWDTINYIAEETVKNNKLFGLDKDNMSDYEVFQNIRVYESLCKEELGELYDALVAEDRDEVLDACIDFCIVNTFKKHLQGTVPFWEFDMDLGLFTNKEDFCKYNNYSSQIFSVFKELKVDHKKAIDIVLASNRSKAPTKEEVEALGGEDKICKGIEAQGRYTGLHTKHVGDRVTFWATHDNGESKLKFVKPPTFVDPKEGLSKCWID